MERIMSPDLEIRMKTLQREHIRKSLSYLEEMVTLAVELEKLTDPVLIEKYNRRLSELEVLVDEDYDIACRIEEAMS